MPSVAGGTRAIGASRVRRPSPRGEAMVPSAAPADERACTTRARGEGTGGTDARPRMPRGSVSSGARRGARRSAEGACGGGACMDAEHVWRGGAGPDGAADGVGHGPRRTSTRAACCRRDHSSAASDDVRNEVHFAARHWPAGRRSVCAGASGASGASGGGLLSCLVVGRKCGRRRWLEVVYFELD